MLKKESKMPLANFLKALGPAAQNIAQDQFPGTTIKRNHLLRSV
jgi:hypothetical protein